MLIIDVQRHGSAFLDTSLEQGSDNRRFGHLVICGLVTLGCVKATFLDACRSSYHLTLVAEGHSSFSKAATSLIEEWNAKLIQTGSQVLPAGEVEFPVQVTRV